MTVHFDTLDYANTLESAGITRAHAEAIAKVQAKALTDLVTNELVTKDFLRSELTQLETRLVGQNDKQGVDLRAAINQQGVDLRAAINQQGVDLRGDIEKQVVALRGDIEKQVVDLRAEIGKQGVDLRAEIGKQGVDLRGEILQSETRMEAMIRRENDALRLQLRSLQFGGAIAFFALSVIVMMSRFIR